MIEVEEELSLLERCEKVVGAGLLVQRLAYVRELGHTAETVGPAEAALRVVPLLKEVLSDPELSVRHTLAEQVAPVARVLASGGAPSYDVILTELVPLLTSLVSGGLSEPGGGMYGGNAQLSEAASEALLEVAALVKPHDIGDTVLRAVLCLAHDNDLEESRVVATGVRRPAAARRSRAPQPRAAAAAHRGSAYVPAVARASQQSRRPALPWSRHRTRTRPHSHTPACAHSHTLAQARSHTPAVARWRTSAHVRPCHSRQLSLLPAPLKRSCLAPPCRSAASGGSGRDGGRGLVPSVRPARNPVPGRRPSLPCAQGGRSATRQGRLRGQ